MVCTDSSTQILRLALSKYGHAKNFNFAFSVDLDNAKKEVNSNFKSGSKCLTAVAILLVRLCGGLTSASN